LLMLLSLYLIEWGRQKPAPGITLLI